MPQHSNKTNGARNETSVQSGSKEAQQSAVRKGIEGEEGRNAKVNVKNNITQTHHNARTAPKHTPPLPSPSPPNNIITVHVFERYCVP